MPRISGDHPDLISYLERLGLGSYQARKPKPHLQLEPSDAPLYAPGERPPRSDELVTIVRTVGSETILMRSHFLSGDVPFEIRIDLRHALDRDVEWFRDALKRWTLARDVERRRHLRAI
jgi:hypothetical protein